MSTDSSELTFVRCPSCRSLVPAVSTRCRMCGATLDASQKSGDDGDKEKKSGRVRQRTMSAPSSELSSAVGAIRQDLGVQMGGESEVTQTMGSVPTATPPPPKPAAKPAPFSTPSQSAVENSNEEVDPLSAYIEEVEIADNSSRSENGSTSGAQGQGNRYDTETTDAPVSRSAPPEVEDRTSPREPDPDTEAPSPAANQPKVIVESGARRANRPSNVSFGRSNEERTAAEPAKGRANEREEGGWHSASRDQQGRDRRDARPIGPEKYEQETESGRGVLRGAPIRPEQSRAEPPRVEAPRADASRQVNRGERVEQVRGREGQSRNQEGAMRNESEVQSVRFNGTQSGRSSAVGRGDEPYFAQESDGRLCGWLVSFKEPRGAALELREGKFFVTSSSLKPLDLVIDDKSISMPHAFAAVSVAEGLRVQDLMSEQGVWVRRKTGDDYQRVTDTVRLEHGDSIRFGEVEFLVSFVPVRGKE